MYNFPTVIYSAHPDWRPSDASKDGPTCPSVPVSCLPDWQRHSTCPPPFPDQPSAEPSHRAPASLVPWLALRRPLPAQRQRPLTDHRSGSQDHSPWTTRARPRLGRPLFHTPTPTRWRAAPRRKKDGALVDVLLDIVAPHTAGDPMSDQKWLNCRLRDIRQQLHERGHSVSKPVISRLLRKQGYTLRANRKQLAGKQHPERDQQFQHLQAQRGAHQTAGQPVISVDTKKKELVGNFKNAGQIWGQEAEKVDAHDFPQDA